MQEHGYSVSPGTLYPILKSLEESDLLEKEEKLVDEVLLSAKSKAKELFKEID